MCSTKERPVITPGDFSKEDTAKMFMELALRALDGKLEIFSFSTTMAYSDGVSLKLEIRV